MCDYPELRYARDEPIRNPMQAQELKSLVESGHYKPDPSQVAVAMLQRRGVRELLSFPAAPPRQVGRSRQDSGFPRRAA
jgi:hypothetical protein